MIYNLYILKYSKYSRTTQTNYFSSLREIETKILNYIYIDVEEPLKHRSFENFIGK